MSCMSAIVARQFPFYQAVVSLSRLKATCLAWIVRAGAPKPYLKFLNSYISTAQHDFGAVGLHCDGGWETGGGKSNEPSAEEIPDKSTAQESPRMRIQCRRESAPSIRKSCVALSYTPQPPKRNHQHEPLSLSPFNLLRSTMCVDL